MGRNRLVGWARSASTSIASLMRYTLDAAMQKATKATATENRTDESVRVCEPAAAGAAITRTFLTHWRGRSALIIPSRRFLGGAPFDSSCASSTSSISLAVCGSAPKSW